LQIQDAVNGAFEIGGGFAIALSIRRLLRDQIVHGFHWGQLMFFTLWGVWNLYYYPHLDQWLSFVGGLGVVIANTVYLGLIMYYSLKEKP